MPRLRLTIELYETTNANEAQTSDEALLRRAARTREDVQRIAMDLLHRGQYYVRWDVVGPVGRMIYDDVISDLTQTTLDFTDPIEHPGSALAESGQP